MTAAILFDFNGVIVDDEPQHCDALTATLAEYVSACKPDPQGYNRARTALELAPRRCMVIEDSLPGLAAAHAAGLRCAMLSTSHAEEACGDAELVWRDFTGHDPAELPWAHG